MQMWRDAAWNSYLLVLSVLWFAPSRRAEVAKRQRQRCLGVAQGESSPVFHRFIRPFVKGFGVALRTVGEDERRGAVRKCSRVFFIVRECAHATLARTRLRAFVAPACDRDTPSTTLDASSRHRPLAIEFALRDPRGAGGRPASTTGRVPDWTVSGGWLTGLRRQRPEDGTAPGSRVPATQRVLENEAWSSCSPTRRSREVHDVGVDFVEIRGVALRTASIDFATGGCAG